MPADATPRTPNAERISEIIAEYEQDRQDSTEQEAVGRLARALAWVEMGAAHPTSPSAEALAEAMKQQHLALQPDVQLPSERLRLAMAEDLIRRLPTPEPGPDARQEGEADGIERLADWVSGGFWYSVRRRPVTVMEADGEPSDE